MPGFKLSRKAKADLKSIALYTEREWGRDQRNHYILQFDQCFHLLVIMDRHGPASQVHSTPPNVPDCGASRVVLQILAESVASEIVERDALAPGSDARRQV